MKMKRMAALSLAALFGATMSLQAFAADTATVKWTEGNPLVAHALGEYEGKIETNSKESFIHSWENGYQVMEADFTYTSDNILVVRHDFEPGGSYYRLEIQPNHSQPVMDSNTFKNTKIIFEQTPLTAEDLLKLMAEYQDVFLITDTKNSDQATVTRQFQDMKRIAQNIGHPEILERIVPQIYNQQMLGWVKSVHDFPQYIYTLYQLTDVDYAKEAAFCAANGIDVVTINKNRISPDMVQTFHKQGVLVYVHTVNRYLQMQELLRMGVDGVYTDAIHPYELPWVGLKNKRFIYEQPTVLKDKTYNIHRMTIMGQPYACLRDVAQMLAANGDFSASYDPATNTIFMKNTKGSIQLGNEMMLQNTGRCITKKTATALNYNGTALNLSGYTIDGELYYNWTELTKALGYTSTHSYSKELLHAAS